MEQRGTALVTGGSSGIGKGVAIVLAEQGYDVAVTYGENREGAEDTAARVRELGRRCFVYQASLELPDPPAECVRRAISDLGRLTLLVNNAGRTIYHSVLTVTSDEMQYIYGLNFRAYILASGEAARHMVREGIAGSIVFISSTHSVRAYAYDTMYGSLKAALNRAVESMALDLAPYGIRVNCVAPGFTKVRDHIENKDSNRNPGMRNKLIGSIPLGRMGTPRDNGELVAFLASEKASYITGVTIKIDGGLVLPGMLERTKNPDFIHSQTDPAWYEQVREEMNSKFKNL